MKNRQRERKKDRRMKEKKERKSIEIRQWQRR